jgi:hypothetical protein
MHFGLLMAGRSDLSPISRRIGLTMMETVSAARYRCTTYSAARLISRPEQQIRADASKRQVNPKTERGASVVEHLGSFNYFAGAVTEAMREGRIGFSLQHVNSVEDAGDVLYSASEGWWSLTARSGRLENS